MTISVERPAFYAGPHRSDAAATASGSAATIDLPRDSYARTLNGDAADSSQPVGTLGTLRDVVIVGGLIAYAIVLVSWLVTGEATATLTPWEKSPATGMLSLAAAALAIQASRVLPLDLGSRRFWRGLAAAILVKAAGDSLAPSGGDLLVASWLPAYTTLAAQLILLVALLHDPSAPRTPLHRTALWLDAGTVMVGGLLVVWYDVQSHAQLDSPILTWSFLMAHFTVVMDLVLLMVASVLWRRTAFRHRAHVMLMIAAALLLNAITHAMTVLALTRGMEIPSWLIALPPASTALLGLAAWFKSATANTLVVRHAVHHARSEMSMSVIPYIVVLPGFALLLTAARDQGVQPLTGLVIGAVVLTALAFARQMASAREAVRALTDAAERHNEARFQALVQHSSDVITILDIDGTIRFISPSVAAVFGHTPSRLVGTRLLSLLHPDDVEVALQFLTELSRADAPRTTPARFPGALKREWRIAHANGEWMTVDNVGTNLLREPVVQGLVLNTRDVTEQSLIKQQYMHQAFHDPLTDLANRSLFLYQVGHALARGARQQHEVTVLFVDLDNFKTVNDSLGHAAGDKLLVEAARRLASCVRDSDLIARLGGDEFAVLIEDAESVDEVMQVAERIASAMATPFHLGGKEAFVSASIGIARTSRGESSDELVRNADVAMYVAKTRGKGIAVMFAPEMHAAALDRLVVEADLRVAIEREEFMLEYQPIVSLATGEIIGAEALVRWTCRERGTVPPGLFLPIAEETGLIVPIGRWVLRRACQMARQWELERGYPMRITVNLSGRQLQEAGIIDDVRAALDDSGLDPEHLVLEITESMLMDHTDMSMARLTALKQLGVSLAIDDFGTGYSSLSYLQRYPIDILKIDKAFVDAIDKEGEGPVLARAIVALGETLRMTTVAEGIETEAQRGQLLQLGCQLGQGYLFAPPLDGEDFYHLLHARGARSYAALRGRREFSEAVV